MYRVRIISILAVLAAATAGWFATGRAAITTWPDPEIDAMLPGPLAERFAQTPARTDAEPPTRFQLGLLPDAPARSWPSVLTITLAGVALACVLPAGDTAPPTRTPHPEPSP